MIPLTHRIKRASQRAMLNYKRKMTHSDITQNKIELELLHRCRELIHHPDAELAVCPDTGDKYIICNPLGIKMIIEGNKIITSHPNYYKELPISKQGINNVVQVFQGTIRARKTEWKSIMDKSSQSLIKDIFKQ